MVKCNLIQGVKWCLSPTLFVSDCYKRAAKTKPIRGSRVKRLNKIYFTLALVAAFSVGMLELAAILALKEVGVSLLIILLSISRCNEIFMAFVKDVFDKLDPGKRDKNGLEYFERIQMALRSYIELILWYALTFFLLEVCYFQQGFLNKPLENLFNAIYFSIVTIVTMGYGDFHPVHPIAKILVGYEVLSGTLLLVVSFTVYVTLTLAEQKKS